MYYLYSLFKHLTYVISFFSFTPVNGYTALGVLGKKVLSSATLTPDQFDAEKHHILDRIFIQSYFESYVPDKPRLGVRLITFQDKNVQETLHSGEKNLVDYVAGHREFYCLVTLGGVRVQEAQEIKAWLNKGKMLFGWSFSRKGGGFARSDGDFIIYKDKMYAASGRDGFLDVIGSIHGKPLKDRLDLMQERVKRNRMMETNLDAFEKEEKHTFSRIYSEIKTLSERYPHDQELKGFVTANAKKWTEIK
jgi:hypothetical protein